jgi:hypothetical protein
MNKCRKKLKVHTGPISCLRVVNGVTYTGSWDGTVYVYTEGDAAGKRYRSLVDAEAVLDMEIVGGFVYAACR